MAPCQRLLGYRSGRFFVLYCSRSYVGAGGYHRVLVQFHKTYRSVCSLPDIREITSYPPSEIPLELRLEDLIDSLIFRPLCRPVKALLSAPYLVGLFLQRMEILEPWGTGTIITKVIGIRQIPSNLSEKENSTIMISNDSRSSQQLPT